MRKLVRHNIRRGFNNSIVSLNIIGFGLKNTIFRPGKHGVSIGRNTRSRNRWRHIEENSKSSAKNRRRSSVNRRRRTRHRSRRIRGKKIDKGSKVANQGSKAGREEEGEKDTESMLDKDGNIDS